jgi:hypothetical protein
MNNLNNKIIVQDNFFTSEILNKIKTDLSYQKFQNRFLSVKENNNQKIYFEVQISPDHPAVQEIKKNLFNLFNLNCGEISSHYFLSTKHEKATPHNDDSFDVNCLIYLKGDYLVNNGTGFYDKLDDKFTLNTHVGFKENRAIIFDSKIYHSSLQFNDNTGRRYCLANFIKIKKPCKK